MFRRPQAWPPAPPRAGRTRRKSWRLRRRAALFWAEFAPSVGKSTADEIDVVRSHDEPIALFAPAPRGFGRAGEDAASAAKRGRGREDRGAGLLMRAPRLRELAERERNIARADADEGD